MLEYIPDSDLNRIERQCKRDIVCRVMAEEDFTMQPDGVLCNFTRSWGRGTLGPEQVSSARKLLTSVTPSGYVIVKPPYKNINARFWDDIGNGTNSIILKMLAFV